MRIHLSLSLLLAASFATAQGALTAHPQETLQNGNGNLVPFGVLSTGSFGEGHTMILIPKDELPSVASLITGIQVHCQGTVTLDYQSLIINMGPATGTQLTTTFANNFASPPTNVLSATSLQLSYSSSQWLHIPFTTPYVHDGVSALVIEIQKVIAPAASYPFATMSTSSSPQRVDRPNMIYSFGTPGSGASTAPTASVSAGALSVRLEWTGTTTIRNLSDVGPSNNQYGIGTNVTLTVNGQPSNLFVIAAATAYLPTALPVPGISGDLRVDSPVLFAAGLLDPAGVGTQLLAIPNDPTLVGFFLCYQAANIDPTTVAISLSNGSDHFINN